MRLLGNLSGQVRLRLTSGDLDGLLQRAVSDGAALYQVERLSDLTAQLFVGRKDWKILEALCQKQGAKLEEQHATGISLQLRQLGKRPILIFGMLLVILLTALLPGRILFVRVEGNAHIPDNQILEGAAEAGITFWASRREVRSERVKNALLERLPQLQWAGVNTRGMAAVISVQERRVQESAESETFPGSILAERDGVILSCDATRGTALCAVGQAVTRGQTLISGYVDSGLALRSVPAEGEVYAQTRRTLGVIAPANCKQKAEYGPALKKISLILGKKRINLWKDSGIWDGVCGRMYAEYYVTLPGGFQLPIAIAVEEYTPCRTVQATLEPETAQALLEDFSKEYLLSQMIAGQILHSVSQVQAQADAYEFRGTFVCTEMIGRFRQEQIGESNGEID